MCMNPGFSPTPTWSLQHTRDPSHIGAPHLTFRDWYEVLTTLNRMGFLTTLRKQKRKDREIRVVVLGLDNAGKTTIVKQLLGQDVNEVSPTVGFSIEQLDWNGFKLNLWDVGGQRSLRPFWRNYFEKTDFLIWVIDATALDRLEDCRRELANALTEDRLVGCGLLILINKIDLIQKQEYEDEDVFDSNTTATIKAVEQRLALDSLVGNHNCRVMGVSGVKGWNLSVAVDWLTSEVSKRLYLID